MSTASPIAKPASLFKNLAECLIPTWKQTSCKASYHMRSFTSTSDEFSLERFDASRLDDFLDSSFVLLSVPSFSLENEFLGSMNFGLKNAAEAQRKFHENLKMEWQDQYGEYRFWAFLSSLQKRVAESPLFKAAEKVAVVSSDANGSLLTEENVKFVRGKGLLLTDPNRNLVDILEFGLSDFDSEIEGLAAVYDFTRRMPPIYCLMYSKEKGSAAFHLLAGKTIKEMFTEIENSLEEVFA